jgi:2-polyprenyl-3-methyl-5-hydroxy-6-metoxy-1,4-benzoquinol methylase
MSAERKESEIWEKRWKGSGSAPRLTWLGRRMIAAKIRALKKILAGIDAVRMIEIGCGLGDTGQAFREAGLDYRGIDISATAVARSRSRGLHVEEKSLEEVEGTFDLVASDGLLEHILDFEKSAREMMRLSQNYVLLIQPNHDSLTGKTLAFLSEIFRKRANVFEYNYRIEDFLRVFERNGFVLVANRSIFGDVFRLLLFRRKAG